jgi:hypothetical protein
VTPRLGASVHYVYSQGTCQAAIVTETPAAGVADVIDTVALAVLTPIGAVFLPDVPYDREQAIGTWHLEADHAV